MSDKFSSLEMMTEELRFVLFKTKRKDIKIYNSSMKISEGLFFKCNNEPNDLGHV